MRSITHRVLTRRQGVEDAMNNTDKYPQLTICVSGYAVNFVSSRASNSRT
jgi:autonomous glycyl radical cofactor GrcA